MQKIRNGLIVLCLLLCSVTFSEAQVSIGIGLPNVSIGINLPLFPQLVRVPGYPVYYAPDIDANYYFYDGMYWVYQDDNWYASSWYNGPWGFVEPQVVPLYILRIPVRYYRQPPVYFRGWQSDAPPRWGQHWGRDWEHRRRGWDRWNRSSVPAPAPLPVYQRQYSGDRYPRVEQQQTLRSQQYRYQPRDKVVREHFKRQVEHRESAPAQRGRQEAPAVRSPRQPEPQRSAPNQQGAPPDPRSKPPQRGGEHVQKPAADHTPPQQRAPAAQEQRQQPKAAQPQREQQVPRAEQPKREHQTPRAEQPDRERQAPRAQDQERRSQGRGESQEPRGDRGQGQGRDDDRGRGRDR